VIEHGFPGKYDNKLEALMNIMHLL